MWSISKAAVSGAILGVVVTLVHLNEQIREFQFWPALEIMNLIIRIGLPAGIFAGIAAIRNAFARRHNQRIARNEERYG
jgi:uncharacterized membrane protein SpoIIM required for sporulation